MREARGPAWTDWLAEHGVAGLTGVDTRALVLHLREHGAMRAGIRTPRSRRARGRCHADGGPRARRRGVDAPSHMSRTRRGTFASRSSTTAASARSSAAWQRPARRSPSTRTTSTRTSSPRYDGVLLSNGPGDPEPLARRDRRRSTDLLGRVPVLGICLGHQLLALATGHETFKLPFGHRGANHPVARRRTGRVLVTSQNHGFAVAPSRRPRGDPRLALRRHGGGPRLPRAACPFACSSIPRPGPGRTMPGRSSSAGWRSSRAAA